MNNITQKNVIAKLRKSQELPYKQLSYVNQYADCTSITHVDVNNTMRQLLDNDLYIESTLAHTSAYVTGPKSGNDLEIQPDGYKMFGNIAGSDCLEILHKVDDPLSSTVLKVDSGDMKFATFWSDMIFVQKNSATRLKYSKSTECESFSNLGINSTCYYQTDEYIFFGASDGVYMLSSYVEDDETSGDYGKTIYETVRLNKEVIASVNAVYFDKKSQSVLVGANSNIYQGKFDPTRPIIRSIEFESQTVFNNTEVLTSDTISHFGSDSKKMIACAGDNVYEQESGIVFKNAKTVMTTSGSGTVTVVAEYNGIVYVGTTVGLYSYNGTSFSNITGGNALGHVVKLKVVDRILYVATEDGFYYVDSQGTLSQNQLTKALPSNRINIRLTGSVIEKISSFDVYKSLAFVATNRGLYSFKLNESVTYINTVSTSGTLVPVPCTSNQFTNITDVLVRNGSLFIGMPSGMRRFDIRNVSSEDTKVVHSLQPFNDWPTEKIVRVLTSNDDIYVVAEKYVVNARNRNLKWMPNDDNEVIADACLAVTDNKQCIIVVTDQRSYVLQCGTPPKLLAIAHADISGGKKVAAVSDVIAIIAADDTYKYVYNSIQSFRNGPVRVVADVHATELAVCNDSMYGIVQSATASTERQVRRFDRSSMPNKVSSFVGVNSSNITSQAYYAWNDPYNGNCVAGQYFVVGSRLKHIQAGFTVNPDSDDPDETPTVTCGACDDVTGHAESDITCVWVDCFAHKIYIGTTQGVFVANYYQGTGVQSPTNLSFSQCAVSAGQAMTGIKQICRGYTSGYKWYKYTYLENTDPNYPYATAREHTVDASDGNSIIVLAEQGIYELRPGSTEFTQIPVTALAQYTSGSYSEVSKTIINYIAVSSNPYILACIVQLDGETCYRLITRANTVSTVLTPLSDLGITDTGIPVDASIRAYRTGPNVGDGWAASDVDVDINKARITQITTHAIEAPIAMTFVDSSSATFRVHSAQLATSVKYINVIDVGFGNSVIRIAGGTTNIIQNQIAQTQTSTFELNVSQYGYIQNTVNVNSFLDMAEQPTVVYRANDVVRKYSYFYDEEVVVDGNRTTIRQSAVRTVTVSEPYVFNPLSKMLINRDYDGYALYATNGVYSTYGVDRSILPVSVKTAANQEYKTAKKLYSPDNHTMYVLAGQSGSGTSVVHEGLQTVDRSYAKTQFNVDDMQYADGNYYFKTVSESASTWKYCTMSDFMSLTSSSTNADSRLVSLDPVFSACGITTSADKAKFEMSASAYGVLAGTVANGIMQIQYFVNTVPNLQQISLPSPLASARIYRLYPNTRAEQVQIVYEIVSGGITSYKVYDYFTVLNTCQSRPYVIYDGTDWVSVESGFDNLVFRNNNGSDAAYVVYDDVFYYTTGSKLLPAPDGLNFENIVAVSGLGRKTVLAQPEFLFAFDTIAQGNIWNLLCTGVGSVNSALDMPDKCILAAKNATSGSIWYYSNGLCVNVSNLTPAIDTMSVYQDGQQRYLCMRGNAMYWSKNYKLWRSVFNWTKTKTKQNTGITQVRSIIRINDRIYIAATDAGLFMTKYSYTLVHDTKPFSKDDALNMYDTMFRTGISALVSSTLSSHISSVAGDHLSTSLITKVNKEYVNVQMDNIAGWATSKLCNDVDGKNYVEVKNDLIAEMMFGDYMDGDVLVTVSGFVTPSPVAVQDISYIMKRWTSGVTEMYINIPSTSSYYVANCFGASNCKHDPADAYQRKNLEQFGVEASVQDSTLSTHYTSISVELASASYRIDNMLDVQINGNSLPLAIYKDNTHTGDTGMPGLMYRSYIEPSVVKEYNASVTNDDGNYVFKFASFGTDAQAIKLMFYDQNSRTAADCVKVVFDPNGGEGRMPNQKFVIIQDSSGKTILEQKPLRKCSFTNTSSGRTKMFVGWSTQPLADNSDAPYTQSTGSSSQPVFPAYTSGENFNDLMVELGDPRRTEPLRRNEVITLYAVWVDYQFSASDTTLLMESDRTDFYIDSVGVDPNTKLRDKVVINFGD